MQRQKFDIEVTQTLTKIVLYIRYRLCNSLLTHTCKIDKRFFSFVSSSLFTDVTKYFQLWRHLELHALPMVAAVTGRLCVVDPDLADDELPDCLLASLAVRCHGK